MRRYRTLQALVAAALLLAACGRGPQPLPPEQLRIRLNILCTTCDDFLECRMPAEASPAPTVVYRLREKGFWAQVATIKDYLLQILRRKLRDERPLTVYVEDRGQRRVSADGVSAKIDLAAGLLAVPDGSIDLRDGAWRSEAGTPRGECRTLPRREGYAFVRAMLGRPLPQAAP